MSTQHHPAHGHNRAHTHGDSAGHHHAEKDAGAPLPIVVGVTGHRDLRTQDLPALEGVVKRILRELLAAHPHTPVLVLSPLAEGSDRLVARVALEVGVRLIVPMPLPQDLYEQDFSSDESRAEFRQLLSRAESSCVLPLMAELYSRLKPHPVWQDIDYSIRGDVRRFVWVEMYAGRIFDCAVRVVEDVLAILGLEA